MRTPFFAASLSSLALVVVGAGLGCSPTVGTTAPDPVDSDVPETAADTDVAVDSTPLDAATDGGPKVRRLPCVDRGGLAADLPLDVFGALEGELVSLVPPGNKACPSDSDHLHLQVDVAGKRYDVAITIDSSTGGTPIALITKDLAPTTSPPGWSAAGFDFPKDLGIPSADFVSMTKLQLLTKLQTELASVSFVSIHGHSYTDGTGLHNIHRNGGGHDGVILVRGGGAGGTDHAIALRFSTDVF